MRHAIELRASIGTRVETPVPLRVGNCVDVAVSARVEESQSRAGNHSPLFVLHSPADRDRTDEPKSVFVRDERVIDAPLGPKSFLFCAKSRMGGGEADTGYGFGQVDGGLSLGIALVRALAHQV